MSIYQFYEHVASLFYAIAQCDGEIHPMELKKLKQLIHLKWMGDPVDQSQGFDVGTIIETTFETLVSLKKDSEEAFQDFKLFVERSDEMNKSMKRMIFNTAFDIANAFEGINDDEKKMLDRLIVILKGK